MNADKIIKIVLLVIMFCTLVGCSFCKVKESFSDTTEKIEEGKFCSYKLGTEGCVGYNCVKFEGKQYEPDHGSCKTEFCNCADNEGTNGNSLCVCDNIVDGLPDEITFTSNDNDYEFNIHLDNNDKKELYYVNKNDPDDEINEYYKYDRQNNMFVPRYEEPTTFFKIKILNVDNMYDVKIEVDGKVFSFKVSSDTKVSCSSNEKLTQLYDNEGKYNNSFCFDDSESGFDDPGPYKIIYSYEKIYDDNVKCHESCKSCGFNDNPSGDSDCITCKDGYKLHPVYPDGTGKCIKVNDNQVEPTTEPTTQSLLVPDLEKPFIKCLDKLANGEIKAMTCGEFNKFKTEGPEAYCYGKYEKRKTDNESVKSYLGKIIEMGGNIIEKEKECPKTDVQTVQVDESDKYEVCLNHLSKELPKMDCKTYNEYLEKGPDDFCFKFNASKKKDKIYMKEFLDLAVKKYDKTNKCKNKKMSCSEEEEYIKEQEDEGILIKFCENEFCDGDEETDGYKNLGNGATFCNVDKYWMQKRSPTYQEKKKKSEGEECTTPSDCISNSCMVYGSNGEAVCE